MSPGDRRAVLLGTIVVVAALATRALATAREALASRRQAAEQAVASLTLARRELLLQDRLHARARQLEGSLAALDDLLLGETTEATATSAFIELVEIVAEESLVSLEAAQPVADTAVSGALRRVTLQVELASDLQGMLDFLLRLGSDPLAVELSSLAISTADPGAAVERLRTDLVLRAWYRGPGVMP